MHHPIQFRSLTILRSTPAALLLALTAAAGAKPQAITYGVSVSPSGDFGNDECQAPRVSDNGRYVVYSSWADNLVPGDWNNRRDVFRHDLQSGLTELVSESLHASGFANNSSYNPDVSSDGRFVVFSSDASDLVPTDSNGVRDIFVRDMLLGVTERVSLTSTGAQASNECCNPRMTPDGRFVTFDTFGSLLPSDTNAQYDVYRADRELNELAVVSVRNNGDQGNGRSDEAAISNDGQRIVFASVATNLIAGDSNGDRDVFLKDMGTGELTRVSTASNGAQAIDSSSLPAISGDGMTVGFNSNASNLVPNDTNNRPDLFAKNLSNGVTERLNVRPSGGQTNDFVFSPLSFSTDGNLVAFHVSAGSLVPNDTNNHPDCFLRDRAAASTRRVSLTDSGSQILGGFSIGASLSGDGNSVAFLSEGTGVVPGDTLGEAQVYAVDLTGSGSVGTSYCSGNVNSTGLAGDLAAVGTTLVAYNQITLSATQLPPDSFGMFIVSRMQGFIANPGGSFGNICLADPIGRYRGPGQVQDSGPAGQIDLAIDLLAMPQPTSFEVAVAGDEWNFQLWHRDVDAFGAVTSNFTKGLSIVLR